MRRPALPEQPPLITAPAQVRTSAGVPTVVPVTITNRAAEPRVYVISPAGVDAAWIPLPAQSGVVAPGESVAAELTLRPAEGTVAARYPLALAVQALDPATGTLQGSTSVHGVDLVVSAPGQLTLSLDPPDGRAVHSRKLFVVLQNTGQQPETVHLEARAPQSTAVDLSRGPYVVPPASTMRVPARLTVTRPTLFRRPVRHSFSVTARTSAAPRHAEGSLTARSLIGPTGAKVVAAIAVVALWVTLALIFVPKLADKVRKPEAKAAGAAPTLTVQPPGTGGKKHGAGQGGGSGTSPNGGGSGSGGGSGGGSAAGGDAAASASSSAKKVQISGTVSGTTPDGVHVSIYPTSFGSSDAAGATGATTQSADSGPIGKLTPDAISHASLAPTPDQSGPAGPDGSFAFTVRPLGFYILQIAKPGYETQRFVVDPTSAAAADPMKVALVSGTGSLHGVVHDASGGTVGAATITLTDGTNTVTTSTVSKGAGVGTWSVTGLSTPSSYLVSASHDGLGVASRLVTLAAGATAPVELTMSSGVATLTGVVRAMIDKHNTRLGGITVTATDGTVTRTSTTVTTGSQTGLFTLPQLALGTWTVTISGSGYQLQTLQVKVAAGQKQLARDVELTPSTVTVSGAVTGLQAKGLPGAGLTLTDQTNTYKQTTLRHGTFAFTGVAPGTYTLTAQYSGYTSQTQTVKATLDKPVKHATFALELFRVTHDATIVGYAANAISSSSSFGCKQDSLAEPIGCTVYFQLYDSNGNRTAVTLDPAKPNLDRPFRDVTKLNGPVPYELSVNTKTKPGEQPLDGLTPGQYKLVISSPGFIPATVRVQVPLNGVAALPEVSLFPANEVAGQLKAAGDIDAQTIATDPAVHNCMLALPVGFGKLDPAAFYCDQAQADAAAAADPAAKVFGPADVTKYADDCTFTGSAEPAMALTTGTGNYDLSRLCDGQYRLYPIVGNRAYVKPSTANPITQTVSNGQTVEYDPSVDRYPLLTLSVNNLDATGSPVLDTNADVTLTCGTTSIAATTDAHGSVTFYGVPTGSPSCAVADAAGNSAGVPNQFRQTNQEYSTTATIVNQTMTLVGRLVAPFGTSDANPIANVPVTVTALTHYNGSTPVYEQASAITNAQGCYAVQPAATAGTTYPASLDLTATNPGATDCGTLVRTAAPATTNIAVIDATQTDVHLTTADITQVRALGDTAVTLLQIPSQTATQAVTLPTGATTQLVPHAIALSDNPQQFRVVDPSGNPVAIGPGTGLSFARATLSVTPTVVNGTGGADQSAVGAGTIDAGVTGDGFLTWSDSRAGANNIWPGRYSYTLTVPGYKAQVPADPALGLPAGALHGELDCGFTAATHTTPGSLGCTLSNADIIAFGTLSGTVQTTTATGSTVAVPNADVYLDACTTTCTDVPSPSITCPARTSPNPYYAQTTPNGTYDFSVAGVRQVLPGDYRLVVCAPGLLPSVQKVTISATNTAPVTVTMQWLGSVSGHLIGFNGVDLGSVAMTLSRCAADGSACTDQVTSTTTGSGGLFNFVSPDNLANFLLPGKYEVTAAPVGYKPVSWSITVAMHVDGTPNDYTDSALQAVAFGGYSGTVSNSFGLGLAGAHVSMTCVSVGGLACPSSVLDPIPVTANDNGKFTFTGGPDNTAFFLTPGQWQVTVTATGYAPFVLDGSTARPYQTIGSGTNTPQLNLSLTPLGALGGTVLDSITHQPVIGAIVKAECATASSGCGSADPLQAKTDGVGAYSFGSVGARNVFAYGTWKFSITAPDGYYDASPTDTVDFGPTNWTPAAPSFSLRSFGSLSGKIVDSTNSALAVSGAIVSATCTSGCGTATVASVTADTSGNFAFGTSGARNVFPDGTWTVSITGPDGYNSGSGGAFTFGPGSTALTTGSLSLRPEGSLSGRIVDSTNPTVAVGAAIVTATCQDSTCATATVPAPVNTDTSGNFAFGTAGARNVFPDGKWTLTITGPTGYNDGGGSSYTFNNSATNLTANGLTLRAKGSLSGKVVDSTNASLAVSGAIVSATCSCGTVDPVNTDSSGNFVFGTSGARNVFADGTWTLSVTAPTGYSDSGALTGQAKTFGVGNLPAQSLTVSLDPLGSLTGIVSGLGATTQRLADVAVTIDRCDPANTSDTSCAGSVSAGTELSTQTSDTGVYTFGSALTPGRWKLSTSATGYTATSKIVHIVAGANTVSSMSGRSESPNLSMDAVPVDLPVQVFLNSSTTAIKHAVVTVRRVDGTGTAVTGDLTGTTYLAKGLLPTAYNVTVTGDHSAVGQSVQTTSVTVGIAATDPDAGSNHGTAPELDITVSLLDFQVTGKLLGNTGGGTSTAVAGANVVLLTTPPTAGPPAAGVAALDYQDNAITAVTADGSQAGVPAGSFTLTHVPNGTYYVSINQPDPTTLKPADTPSNGFAGTQLGPITVLNGIYSLGTQTLDPVSHPVTVTVNKYADDDLGAVTPTLSLPSGSPLGWGDQTGTLSSTSTATKSIYTFTSVPAGCWTFALAGLDTAKHKGALNQDTLPGTCPASSFPISGTQDTSTVSSSFTIHERHLALTSTVTPTGVGTAPTFDLKIGSYDVGNLPASSTATTDYYLPPAPYALTVTPSVAVSPRVWPITITSTPVDLTSSGQTATVTALQTTLQSLTIPAYGGATVAHPITYTVACSGTGCTNIASYLPANPISDDGTSPSILVSGLPPGAYSVTAAGQAVTGHTATKTVTLPNSGNTFGW
jgi:hypothetical protein